MSGALDRRGVWMAVGAYVVWGVMPLYWTALSAVPSLQIIYHRIIWGAGFVALWLGFRHGRGWLKETLARPRAAWMLPLSGTLIALNWGLYIWAVNAGHVVETSLGYFINPLLNVLIGVLFLRERLSRLQWLSIAIAFGGVLWMTFNYGHFPWIALTLAASFTSYGLVRKLLDVPPIRGLGVESLYLVLPAIGLALWGETHGMGGFVAHGDTPAWGWGLGLMLVLGGALTVLPLIGFADAVRRIPFTLVGLLQYIGPTLQLIIGVWLLHEPFGPDRLIGFVFIWAALGLFIFDGLIRGRRRRQRLRAAEQSAAIKP